MESQYTWAEAIRSPTEQDKISEWNVWSVLTTILEQIQVINALILHILILHNGCTTYPCSAWTP